MMDGRDGEAMSAAASASASAARAPNASQAASTRGSYGDTSTSSGRGSTVGDRIASVPSSEKKSSVVINADNLVRLPRDNTVCKHKRTNLVIM